MRWIWKLPVLRGMTQLQRGMFQAVAATALLSACLAPAVHTYLSSPSPEFLRALAQIAATLLVAYALEASWVLKESRVRGGNRENWVGVLSGVGLCGVSGIGVMLGLSESSEASWSVLQGIGFAWCLASLAFLALAVGLLPSIVYEWAHVLHSESPDDE